MRCIPFPLFSRLAFLLGAVLVSLAPTLASAEQMKAVIPVPQTETWWTDRHERTVTRVREGQVDLLFIGDSITQGWEEDGRLVWDT